jgi:hypothetical protein
LLDDELTVDDAHVRLQALVLMGDFSATSTLAAEPIHLFGVHVHASFAQVFLQARDLSATWLGSGEPETTLRTAAQERDHRKPRHSPLSVVSVPNGCSVVQDNVADVYKEVPHGWRENATMRGTNPRDPQILACVWVTITRRNHGAPFRNANLDDASPSVSHLTVDDLDDHMKSLPRLHRGILIAGSSRADPKIPKRAFISTSQSQRTSVRLDTLREATGIFVAQAKIVPIRRVVWRHCNCVFVCAERLVRKFWPLTCERVPKRVPDTSSEHRILALLLRQTVESGTQRARRREILWILSARFVAR